MNSWNVQPYDDTINKKLKKHKSNAPVIKNFKNFIQELELVEDPVDIGDRKHSQYRNCFGIHMTKSISLIYTIDYEKHVVYLVDLDDHKTLYRRDNHS